MASVLVRQVVACESLTGREGPCGPFRRRVIPVAPLAPHRGLSLERRAGEES